MGNQAMIDPAKFYIVWTGSLHLGDTPGVFMDAQFVGLLVQIPVSITYLADDAPNAQLLLTTTEVEVFNGKRHPCYWDWTPGSPLPTPVGYIDDVELTPGKPELHLIEVPRALATVGKHWLTIYVNAEIPAGMRDDFVLKRLEAHESVGAKIGW